MTDTTPKRSPMGMRQMLEFLVIQNEATKEELLNQVQNLQLEVVALKQAVEKSKNPIPPQEIEDLSTRFIN